MPVIAKDRPIETLRKEVTDQLIMNYSHGELSLEAFERRLDEAMATDDHDALVNLTADLELTVDEEFINSQKEQMSGNYVPGESDDVETMFQLFSGSDRSGEWRLPKELRVISVFSGCNVDLTDAIFTNSVLTIKMFNIFSGNNIYIPEGVNVQTKAFCIFGGVDNSVSSAGNPNAPTIIIEGFVLFSGVDISIKRSLKERFVMFADKLKTFLS
jgi:hypothetical protein